MRKVLVTVASTLALSLLACGAGSAGSAVRAADPTASETMGESSCRMVADDGQPLIVDWKAHHRANLEEAMGSGVAVVSYDCNGLRLLADCHLDGSYGLIAVSRKEEVIELENADEVRANLPTFGGKLAVELGGEMNRGTSINLATILVGKKRTTVASADRSQLRGKCDGATHFVRGAFLGAFAMATGARGKVHAAAQLFGAASSAESGSTKHVSNKDGEPGGCAQVEPGATALPSSCNAVLRLELSPIAAVAAPARRSVDTTVAASQSPTNNACPQGLAFSGGKCVPPSGTRSYDCNGSGLQDCLRQCSSDNASSCAWAGALYQNARNHAEAAALYRRACDGGSPEGCGNLGWMYESGRGLAKDDAQAAALYRRACDGGDAEGCGSLGRMYESGRGLANDDAQAVALYRRACDGGHARGCGHLGEMFELGRGVTRDQTQAAALFRRACDGGQLGACAAAAGMYALGEGGAKDDVKAVALYRRACDGGNASGCWGLGVMYAKGRGVARDVGEALTFFRRACDGGHARGCEDAAKLKPR